MRDALADLLQGEAQYAAVTDVGMRRTTNQDSYAVQLADTQEAWEQRGHVFVVADGMGGHNAGDVAARITVATSSSARSSADIAAGVRPVSALSTSSPNVFACARSAAVGSCAFAAAGLDFPASSAFFWQATAALANIQATSQRCMGRQNRPPSRRGQSASSAAITPISSMRLLVVWASPPFSSLT